MRSSYVSVLLFVVLGLVLPASASPIVEVAVAPDADRQNPSGDGYYAKFRAHAAELDEVPDVRRDCTVFPVPVHRPSDPVQSVLAITAPVMAAPPDPTTFNSFSGYTPDCIVFATGLAVTLPPACLDQSGAIDLCLMFSARVQPQPQLAGGPGYLAWHTPTGNFYFNAGGGSNDDDESGNLPFGYTDDCEDCPPVVVV